MGISIVQASAWSSENQVAPLRSWPAVVLLMLMAAVRYSTSLVESPSMALFMLAFMGPAVIGGLILVWWLIASRATWIERLTGFFVVLGIAILASALLDKSMQGMGVMIFVLPAGCAAFSIPLILFAKNPNWRLPAALIASLFGFGMWNAVQSTGVSGTFESSFDWRWNATAEQRYLATLAMNKPTSEGISAEPTVPEIKGATSPWPSFRGALRDGKLAGVALSEDWTSNKPKPIWKMKIGPGWSSFSIASNRLFTQEQRGDKEAVVCLNSETGETIWVHTYVSRFWESLAGAGPRATPTVADEGLYCMGADGILSCLNAGTGAEIWHRDLKSDSGRQPPMWGFSSSPLIADGVVIVHAGGKEDKGLLAYKAKTGEPVWSVASGDHSYSSPQRATFDGVSGVLMESNAGLQFLNVADGSKIWQYDWPVENYRTLQPLVIGNSVLIATGLGGGTRRISVTHQDGEWSTREDWTSKDMKPDFNDFVEHQGFLYGFDGNIFGCINLADGKRQWKKGRYGNGQVLLLSTAGQLLVTSETGEIALLRADENQFIELAKFQAIDGKTWNHSVLLGNRVFVRNGEEAACYELPR